MLNFNQLRVFYHAARTLSFTLAAKELFITQPAVTAQVKSLEDCCDIKLFKRKGRGLCLTDEGKTLYAYALRVFEYEKEIENVIQDMRQLKRGVLRVGASKAYTLYIMPFLIHAFHLLHPLVKINVNEGNSTDLTQSLHDLQIEVGFIATPENRTDLTFIPFAREEIMLIMAPDHRLAGKESITLNDISQEPIIMKHGGSGTRRVLDRFFAEYQFSPNILMETSNDGLIIEMVKRGEGISFLVKPLLTAELENGQILTAPIGDIKLWMNISIAYLRGQSLSKAAQAFIDMLVDMTPANMASADITDIISRLRVQPGYYPTTRD
ncbi:MAG: LysR family transcriptional regulator [Syntrophales bacterium]|jgi:DNA-binding transcriptional LysR family regulator|nr:LysR family transcriptional regulator [Syntrophales bacterium]